jgi:hypothetical protein
MPRFVLLYHQCRAGYERPSHWDFMLESGGLLRTWALPRLPIDWKAAHERTAAIDSACPPIAGGSSVDAEQLPDHRLVYLDYEGPVSHSRGHVSRIEAGTFIANGERSANWQVTLVGNDVYGEVTLHRSTSDGDKWTLAVRRPC